MSNFVQFLNYLLAIAMWFVIGRLTLGLFIRNPKNPVWQLFLLLTDPVYTITRKISFDRVPENLMGLATIVWIIIARFLVIQLA